MMLAIYILSGAVVGAVAGITFAMKLICDAINRADICHEDKRFMRDLLGMPQK